MNATAAYQLMPTSKQYFWLPQRDITAYELALCLPLVLTPVRNDARRAIEALPLECRRHFKEA